MDRAYTCWLIPPATSVYQETPSSRCMQGQLPTVGREIFLKTWDDLPCVMASDWLLKERCKSESGRTTSGGSLGRGQQGQPALAWNDSSLSTANIHIRNLPQALWVLLTAAWIDVPCLQLGMRPYLYLWKRSTCNRKLQSERTTLIIIWI